MDAEESSRGEGDAVEPRAGRWRQVVAVVRSVILWVAAVIGLACILLFAASVVFGVRPQVVVSGSMEPQIPTGALILTVDIAGGDLKVGDVVTVPLRNGEGFVTHRIIAIEPSETGFSLTLQGDANASPDPGTYEVTHAGRVVTTIPYVGFLASMIRTPFGIAGIVLFALAIIALFAVDVRRKR